MTRFPRFLLLAVVALFNSHITLQAARLHVIIAADVTDPSVGEASKADADLMADVFKGNLPANTFTINYVSPNQMTAAGIRNAIRNVRVQRDDAIMFYYSGHGGDQKNGGLFLSLRNQTQTLRRDELSKALTARGARLVVLVTEACANFVEIESDMQAAPSRGEPRQIPPLFARLFFRIQGFVDLNACRRGQKAMTFPESKYGSLFSASFAKLLDKESQSNGLDWTSFVSLVNTKTNEEFKKVYPRGITTETANGRVRQRSQDPEFITPLRVSDVVTRRPSRPRQYSFDEVIEEIDPANGNVFYVTYRRTYFPNNNTVQSRRIRADAAGRAQLVYSVNGIAYWESFQGHVFANPQPNERRQNTARIPVPNTPPAPVPNQPPVPTEYNPQFVKVPLGITMGQCNEPGVHIQSVKAGSPATRCYIIGTGQRIALQADDHILNINGYNTTHHQHVIDLVKNSSVQLNMQVRIRKTGNIHAVTTSLAASDQPNLSQDRLGLVCTDCKTGVHVSQVVPNSPATRVLYGQQTLQINPGVHVVSVNGIQVRNAAEYYRALRNAPQSTWIRVLNTDKKNYDLRVMLNY